MYEKINIAITLLSNEIHDLESEADYTILKAVKLLRELKEELPGFIRKECAEAVNTTLSELLEHANCY